MRPKKEVELSLLQTGGEKVQAKSGLNWGQRPDREPNQACIHIPVDIAKSDFFPEKKSRFTVTTTDDNFTFIGVIAQDNDKGLESTENNSILGKYFRKRLGLADGVKVEKEDLENYGRTSVTFIKIDDKNYIMDFSLPKN